MIKEIYEKFSNDSTGDDQLDSAEKGEDIKLGNKEDQNNETKKCC